MDDLNAFERQVAGEFVRRAGPVRPVDAAAIFTAFTATQSPKWRFQSMFSATKFVVAGAIVALFGGFLLASVLTQPSEETAPAATTDAPGTFSSTGTLIEPGRVGHDTIPLRDGRVLLVGGWFPDGEAGDPVPITAAEVWDPEAGSFSPAGTHGDGRVGATTTLLPDGRVLVVGGGYPPVGAFDPGEITSDDYFKADAQVWDPASESFHAAGSLEQGRSGHSAALLPDGRVLIVGGENDGPLAAAEAWDPESMSFDPAGSLNEARGEDTTTIVLPDGRVLVVGGGYIGDSLVGTAEVWDPETATFSLAGSLAEMTPAHPLAEPRSDYTATLLEDGRVLFVGGAYPVDPVQAPDFRAALHAEIWDPETMSFGPGGSLAEGRSYHTATRLPDGRVLVIGGWRDPDESGAIQVATAELWDPATETFGPAGSLAEARADHRATLLADGRVLVVGGGNRNGEVAAAELWDPESMSFSPAGSLAEARYVDSATLLPDGRVLVFSNEGTSTTAEVWTP